MKYLRNAAIAIVAIVVAGSSPASADIAQKARAYCGDLNDGYPKRVERCVRGQLRSANAVGELLKRHSAEPEVKRIFERCGRKAEETPGIHNWNSIQGCMSSEIKSYKKFNRAVAAGKGDEFISGVIAYCRETQRRPQTYIYANLESCRNRQTKAGYEVGEAFDLVDENSPAQFAMDDCATKFLTKGGNYNWVSVNYCTKRVLRRLQKRR